jgi:serine/threonine protein kinase
MALAKGKRISTFVVTESLGAGGMGEVYRAQDTRLERDVAIKVLREGWDDDAAHAARFEREAKSLASLNHPNVAHVYGYDEWSGRRYLVMELVEGEELAERIERGPARWRRGSRRRTSRGSCTAI